MQRRRRGKQSKNLDKNAAAISLTLTGGAEAMTSLASKASQNQYQTLGLLRLSLNFLKSFSTTTSASPSTPSPAPASSSTKPKRRKKKNLFEVAQFLPNWGIGYHMAKTHWANVSYEITKINLYKVWYLFLLFGCADCVIIFFFLSFIKILRRMGNGIIIFMFIMCSILFIF